METSKITKSDGLRVEKKTLEEEGGVFSSRYKNYCEQGKDQKIL